MVELDARAVPAGDVEGVALELLVQKALEVRGQLEPALVVHACCLAAPKHDRSLPVVFFL